MRKANVEGAAVALMAGAVLASPTGRRAVRKSTKTLDAAVASELPVLSKYTTRGTFRNRGFTINEKTGKCNGPRCSKCRSKEELAQTN